MELCQWWSAAEGKETSGVTSSQHMMYVSKTSKETINKTSIEDCAAHVVLSIVLSKK